LINLLLAKVKYGGKIAFAVASSGIATTLLLGGLQLILYFNFL
jgi:hypothetical protein